MKSLPWQPHFGINIGHCKRRLLPFIITLIFSTSAFLTPAFCTSFDSASVLLQASTIGAPPPSSGKVKVPGMNSFDSRKADSLAESLIAMAKSRSPVEHERLRSALASSESLLELNSEQDYSVLRPEQLRVARVIDALVENRSEPASKSLAFLAENTNFLAEEARQQVLLSAAARLRPLPPAMVHFFDAQSKPDATNLYLAVRLLVENGSEPAIAIFERILSDKAFEPEDKSGWMLDSIVPHRCDVPLLSTCQKLLQETVLSGDLKEVLVEALFDYRPQEWYPADSDRPRPPDRSKCSSQARDILKRIGGWALQQPKLPERLKSRVRTELSALEKPK
jgi:hypothetical protein